LSEVEAAVIHLDEVGYDVGYRVALGGDQHWKTGE
jgi:hypothetical protein